MEHTQSVQRYEVWRSAGEDQYTVERRRPGGKWARVGTRKTLQGTQSLISKDIERTQKTDAMISVIEWFVPAGDGPGE